MRKISVLICAVAVMFVAVPWANAQTSVYVANYVGGTVSVINSSTNQVFASVPVGSGSFGVAVTPDGNRAYVTNMSGDSVSVIDTNPADGAKYNTVVQTITGFNAPLGVAITPDGSRAYVTNNGSSILSVIDTNPADGAKYNTVIKAMTGFASPVDIAITPDGSRAYVTNNGSGTLSVIDTNPADGGKYNTVVQTLTGFSGPSGVAITPDGSRAYVTNNGSGTLSVIDTNPADGAKYNTVIKTMTGFQSPVDIAITPDGSRAYITSTSDTLIGDGLVSVIDTNPADAAYNTVVQTITGFNAPHGVAITPDGSRAYVTNILFTYSTVSVIDTNPADGAKYNTVVRTIGGFNNPYGVATTPDVLFSHLTAQLALTPGAGAGFQLNGELTLGDGTPMVDAAVVPVSLRVGTYSVTIPAGSFQPGPHGTFAYSGTLGGVTLNVRLDPMGADAYQIQVEASGVNLSGLTNPVEVMVHIGNNAGAVDVNAGH